MIKFYAARDYFGEVTKYIADEDSEIVAHYLGTSEATLLTWGQNESVNTGGEFETLFVVDACDWKDFKEVYNVSA